MLKIAIYSGVVPSTTFIERLIDGVSKKDIRVYLFGLKEKGKNYSENIIVSTYSGKINKLFRLIYFSLLLSLFRNKDKKKLDKFIKKSGGNQTLKKIKFYPVLWYQPNIFHIQWAKSIEDWVWVKEFGIKLVVSFRGAQINYHPIAYPEVGELYLKYFPLVDGFHAVSQAIGREAQKYGADPAKIKTVYSGFPLDKVPDTPIKKTNNFQILSIGRSHWMKGYNYALDCMKILSEKGLDFHYTIIGAKGVEELEYQVHDLNLQQSVTLIDRVPFQKVLEMILESDLILLPSVEEGIANVVLEGMMLKKIVLTTNCGGMEEIVKDGYNGFVVNMRTPMEMAEKILDIRNINPDRLHTISENARKTIEEFNSEQRMVSDMVDLYHKVLNS